MDTGAPILPGLPWFYAKLHALHLGGLYLHDPAFLNMKGDVPGLMGLSKGIY